MSCIISSIHNCPVKSVSFQSIDSCEIKKNIGIVGDRVFAFSQGLDADEAKLFEKSPDARKGKWNKILTLKNSPVLNKYNFLFGDNKLSLTFRDKEVLTININQLNDREELVNKIIELESSLKKPIYLMKNKEFPFFDTSVSNKVDFTNSISLLNLQSIKDFQNKIDKEIEISRFRGNLYFDGINAWEERNWIGKIIKIKEVIKNINSFRLGLRLDLRLINFSMINIKGKKNIVIPVGLVKKIKPNAAPDNAE